MARAAELQYPLLSEAVCAFIEQYIRIPEGKAVGQPMKLMPWQREWLQAVFDNPHGTRRAILSVARKSSKTTLIAALLLAYVVGPLAVQNSQVFSAALSRDQAGLVFGLMAKMIRMNPDLAEYVVIRDSAKELLCTLTGVKYRALSADSSTAMGLSPVAFCLDEAGQVRGPQFPLYDALSTAQGAHAAPIEFIISTQAEADSDFLSLMIDDALKGGDPHTVCHLYSAPADCDLRDETAWAAANPAMGTIVSAEYIRQLAEEAVRLPSRESRFRNLILNQRCTSFAPFVSPSLWMRNAAAPHAYEGEPVYAGLDLSSTTDLTALVACWRRDGQWQVAPYFWTPEKGLRERAQRDRAAYDQWVREGYLHTTPGASIDFDYLAEKFLEIADDWNLRVLSFDRWRFEQFKSALIRKGAGADLIEKLRPHGQGFRDMSPSIDLLETELLNERLAHGAHPVLQMCAANATVLRDAAGNRKLDKGTAPGASVRRIDGIVALAMALGGSAGDTPEAEQTHDGNLMFINL